MPDTFTQWPSGIRDTTEFPTISIDVNTSIRDHLRAFCELDGVAWNAYDAQATAGGLTATASRLRTYRKMYERLGLIYNASGTIRLSDLGKGIKNIEANLVSERDELLSNLRRKAISILGRYQLKNPIDGPDLPDSCDVMPYLCIWKAMLSLDNKINYEEMNRVILRILTMSELEIAIQKIRNARLQYGNYAQTSSDILDAVLGPKVHMEQPTARIAPWFAFAGWGGLIIEQQTDADGYRELCPDAIPIVENEISKEHLMFQTTDRDEWLSYYIGDAADTEIDEEAVEIIGTTPDRTPVQYLSPFQRNRIIFGAPGTGKSFALSMEKEQLLSQGGQYERVTFHPDYSYANFVGTYKPVPCKDSDGKDAITYSYVPGPFMRTYVKALQSSRTDTPKPYLLIIEEINRANVAAVFGDVFQLLDRRDDDVSEYPIQASEDIKKFLSSPEQLGGEPADYAEIRIPDNMFIWATMNSADQGVFPMDTAFKRRWDFTYLGIDDNEEGIQGKAVVLGTGEYRRVVEWNALRKAINEELLTYKVNEDKLMGPYFISKKTLSDGTVIDPATFCRVFKNKVLMYLFDDAAKQKRDTLFDGCENLSKRQYSKICKEFDQKGVFIFNNNISSQFVAIPEDDEQ